MLGDVGDSCISFLLAFSAAKCSAELLYIFSIASWLQSHPFKYNNRYVHLNDVVVTGHILSRTLEAGMDSLGSVEQILILAVSDFQSF